MYERRGCGWLEREASKLKMMCLANGCKLILTTVSKPPIYLDSSIGQLAALNLFVFVPWMASTKVHPTLEGYMRTRVKTIKA
ncbi:hypothetical protein V8C34DRAFT_284292 [Trichoderma compactum]